MDEFERLFNEHFHSVYHYVYYMLGNKTDTEDVTQEIFMKIAKSYEQFHEVSALKAWIYTIARRTVIDFLRKRKTKKFLTFWKNHLPDEFDVADESKAIPEERYIQKEECQRIYDLVNQLPEKMRTVIYLRYIQGIPVQEVAAMLDMTPNNVSVIQNRALAKLRNMVDSKSWILEEIK